MGRIRLKKKKKRISKWSILFFLIIILFMSSIYFIYYLSKTITPILVSTGEIRINKYSTTVINKAISQVLDDKISTDKLFNNVVDKNGNISVIDFNSSVVNQILSVATTVVLNNLKLLETGDLESIGISDLELSDEERLNLKKGIIAYIPMGAVTNITLLSNLGPKIPIRLHYVGDVNSNITTRITSYGINNALIEIGIHLEVTAQIILPFTSSVKVLNCDMPIAIKMIQGSVPNFYSGSIDKDSSIYTIPIE